MWARWERSPYLQHYSELLKSQYLGPELILARQQTRIAELLTHAYRTTDFWRNRLDGIGLIPADSNVVARWYRSGGSCDSWQCLRPCRERRRASPPC